MSIGHPHLTTTLYHDYLTTTSIFPNHQHTQPSYGHEDAELLPKHLRTPHLHTTLYHILRITTPYHVPRTHHLTTAMCLGHPHLTHRHHTLPLCCTMTLAHPNSQLHCTLSLKPTTSPLQCTMSLGPPTHHYTAPYPPRTFINTPYQVPWTPALPLQSAMSLCHPNLTPTMCHVPMAPPPYHSTLP